MKQTLRQFLFIASLAAIAALMSACAHVVKKSETTHARVVRAVALPPGWTLAAANETLNLPLAESAAWAGYANPGTNFTGAAHPVAFTVIDESWTDYSRGGGTFLFTDPQASQINSTVSNQAALAGAHQFGVGTLQSTISSNAVSAIGAGGTAVGNIIGAAASAVTK